MVPSRRQVLVTGGTRGIGRALVERCVARGWAVVATGRTRESCAAAAAVLPSVRWEACDLASAASRRALIERLHDLRPDLVVHNAAIQVLRDVTATDSEGTPSLAAEIDVDLVAPMELSWAIVPAMPRGSQLVFVTSGLALAPKASSPVYCACKAGLRSFAKALRAQLAPSGILVVEALPALVDTDMTRGRGRRKMEAGAVADALLVGLDAGRAEIDIGATRWLRWLMRLSPRLAEALMIGR